MPYLSIFSVPHCYTLTSGAENPDATIVFVHGWLLSQRYWEPVIDLLKDDFRCVSYDLRGFGASSTNIDQRSPSDFPNSNSPPIPAYSLEAYAQDLGALLQGLNLNGVWLVGHSLGGSVALWAARLFPDRVQGVICVNAGGGVYLPEEFSRFRRAGQQIVRWRPAWLSAVPFLQYVFAQLMVFKPLGACWGKQRIRDLLAADTDAALGTLLESTTEAEVHRLPQMVAHLKRPAYFIAGANDRVMEEKYVRHLASFHPLFESPQGNVAVLSECGHMAMVEQPTPLAQTLRQLIRPQLSPPTNPQQPDSVLR